MSTYPTLGKYARSKGPVKKPFISLPGPKSEGKWVVIKTVKGKGK